MTILLDPYRKSFAAYWTNMRLYWDSVTSNRAESAHVRFKRQLWISQYNFENCWINIHFLLELQYTKIKASLKKA